MTKKEKIAAKPYSVSFVFDDNTYTVEADSVAEGIGNIKPKTISSYCMLQVKKDDKFANTRLSVVKTRKLLSSKEWQQVFDKKMNALLK